MFALARTPRATRRFRVLIDMDSRIPYRFRRRNESSSPHKSTPPKWSCNPSKPRLFAFVNSGLLRRAFGRQVRLGRIARLCVKIDPALYSQILLDERISNGSFRLWHLLLGMTGKNPCCWPSVTTIAKKLHTNRNSVMKWITELEAALYLRVERGHQHKSNRYFVGTKTLLGSTKSSPIGGTKTLHELNSSIQSNSVSRASEPTTDLVKPESNTDPAIAAEFFRRMREQIP